MCRWSSYRRLLRYTQSALTDSLASKSISAAQISADYERRRRDTQQAAEQEVATNGTVVGEEEQQPEEQEREEAALQKNKRKRAEEEALATIKRSKSSKSRKVAKKIPTGRTATICPKPSTNAWAILAYPGRSHGWKTDVMKSRNGTRV